MSLALSGRCLPLYVLSFLLAAHATISPGFYTVPIALVIYLCPVVYDIYSCIKDLERINMDVIQVTTSRKIPTLRLLEATRFSIAASAWCLFAYIFLTPSQLLNNLLLLACPLWHNQLSTFHHEGLRHLKQDRDCNFQDRNRLAAGLATAQESLTTSKQELAFCSRRLHRAATENIHFRKERISLFHRKNNLEARLSEALDIHHELDMDNQTLSEEVEYLNKKLDDKEVERRTEEEKTQKAEKQMQVAKHRLNMLSSLDCVPLKSEKSSESTKKTTLEGFIFGENTSFTFDDTEYFVSMGKNLFSFKSSHEDTLNNDEDENTKVGSPRPNEWSGSDIEIVQENIFTTSGDVRVSQAEGEPSSSGDSLISPRNVTEEENETSSNMEREYEGRVRREFEYEDTSTTTRPAKRWQRESVVLESPRPFASSTPKRSKKVRGHPKRHW